MRTFVATKNRGKLAELVKIFANSALELETFADYRDPEEGDTSYADNAALKANALRNQLQVAGIEATVLADDSGLEVLALGNRPGVLSARYGGIDATWAERRTMLVAELDRVQERAAAEKRRIDRSARFVCALHAIFPNGAVAHAQATIDGTIAPRERGDGGFSYDAIFTLPDGRTFAELPPDEKNRVSHRALAAAELLRRCS